jgi:hypothetical protein
MAKWAAKAAKKPDEQPKKGSFTKQASKSAQPASSSPSSSGASDFRSLINWAYEKATSHPISQIEHTLNTGKPPEKKPAKKLIPDSWR